MRASPCQVAAGPDYVEVAITKARAASLKTTGIAAPAGHFKGTTIRAKGTVKVVDGVPRVEAADREAARASH